MELLNFNPQEYTILVVDDMPNNVQLLQALLRRAKYKIITAENGFGALEAVKQRPDLILLDIMMPDIDGYEVISRLKADPATQEIPVIFLTALIGTADIVRGFKLGASDYVTKPFQHEELLARVAHHIQYMAARRVILRQRAELQESINSRDKMYSVIAHDLRSPIGTMKMMFNMLSMSCPADQIGEENFEMITMGNEIAESTFMLLDNLLKWTKSQTGRMNTVFQQTNICEVVQFASKMADQIAQVKNIEVQYRIPKTPIEVHCDVDMVKTIIRNLVSNAMKFSEEGSRIIVSVEDGPTHAVVGVQDFGVGIAEENIPKLLNPQIHFTTYGTHNEEGSGLGLQLCQDLARRNGGDLFIHSKLGEGSTFSFTVCKELPAEGGGPVQIDK